MCNKIQNLLEETDLQILNLHAITEAASAGFSLKSSADPAAVLSHIGDQLIAIKETLEEAITLSLQDNNAEQ